MTPFKLDLPKAMGAFAITWRPLSVNTKKKHIIINTSSINIFISAYAGHVC
jgi:hypothetical protein